VNTVPIEIIIQEERKRLDRQNNEARLQLPIPDYLKSGDDCNPEEAEKEREILIFDL